MPLPSLFLSLFKMLKGRSNVSFSPNRAFRTDHQPTTFHLRARGTGRRSDSSRAPSLPLNPAVDQIKVEPLSFLACAGLSADNLSLQHNFSIFLVRGVFPFPFSPRSVNSLASLRILHIFSLFRWEADFSRYLCDCRCIKPFGNSP